MNTLLFLIGVAAMLFFALAAYKHLSQPAVLHLPARKPVKILDRLTDPAALKKKLDAMPSSKPVQVDRDQVIAAMKEEIFGQDSVIEDAVMRIWGRFAAVNRTKPVGVFLIVGPPGIGKSRFGKALGQALYGEQGAESFDMAEFSGGHTASGLFGSPPDHAGGMGMLSKYLLANPKSVVVLDEFEKAHRDVQRKFLGPWNDGTFADQKTGRKVSTTDTVFVITTNAQEDQIARLAVTLADDREELERRVRGVLRNDLENSILSRIDHVFVYQPLQRYPFAALILRFIETHAKDYNIAVMHVDDEVLYQYVLRHHHDKIDGRAVEGVIQKDLTSDFIALQQAGKTSAKITWNAKKQALSVTAAT